VSRRRHCRRGQRRLRDVDAARIGLTSRLLLLAVAVFVLALVPRLLAAISSRPPTRIVGCGGRRLHVWAGERQLGRTYQNGHPGVTTMWIGLLSLGPDGALRFAIECTGCAS